MPKRPPGVDSEESPKPAAAVALHPVYPNPVTESATISYRLPRASDVSIGIYDVVGREVAMIFSGFREDGAHTIVWNAQSLPAGVYSFRMIADGLSDVQRLVRMR